MFVNKVRNDKYLGRIVPLDSSNAPRYYPPVIVGFKSVETKRIFDGFVSRRYPADIQVVALRKLLQLHAATTLTDLRVPPGNRLEKLSGDREGQFSIRINDQWRICFIWTAENNAESVEIVDYH